jgi:putative copper resistance protein D
VPLDQVDRATVNLLISGTAIGTVWQVRVAALLLVLYFSIVGWRRPAFALWSAVSDRRCRSGDLGLDGSWRGR